MQLSHRSSFFQIITECSSQNNAERQADTRTGLPFGVVEKKKRDALVTRTPRSIEFFYSSLSRPVYAPDTQTAT